MSGTPASQWLGTSGADGVIQFSYPGSAAHQTVLLEWDGEPRSWKEKREVVLDPGLGDEKQQATGKLRNLGFIVGPEKDGLLRAVIGFQARFEVDVGLGLDKKGNLPPKTKARLWDFFKPPPEAAAGDNLVQQEQLPGAQPLQEQPPTSTPVAPLQTVDEKALEAERERLGKDFVCWVIDTLGTPEEHHKGWRASDWGDMPTMITKELNELLERTTAIAKWKITSKPTVRWGTALPADVVDHALVVYLCAYSNSRHSAKTLGEVRKTKPPRNGATIWLPATKTMLCEVWPMTLPEGANGSNLAERLAKVIFHEWMHIKIDAHPDDALPDSENVHSGSFGDVGRPDIPEGITIFDDPTLNAMAARLHKPYKPFRR